jgi:peptidyl-prolyl cis-trans isomerase A (cyclophilin A)
MSKLTLATAALSVLLAAAALAQTAAVPVQVLMKTSLGDITLEIYSDKAPVTVKNFLDYVDAKFYDGTIFHRVMDGFMIQGGGMTPDLREKPARPPIKNESGNGLKNARGAIAMARTNDLNSATCQFFIDHVDNFNLDPMKYAVFGKVVKGLEVVDAIAKVPTGTQKGHGDVPLKPVTIVSVRRVGGQ